MTDLTLNSPLRDLIRIPDRVEAADYVIKVSEGVERHEQTVRDYVVTEAIAEAIAAGIDLVANTLERQSSRGAFLDGSFGSGKSHYMAVMHLLLTGSIAARQIPGIQAVVADRLETLEKKLLVLDFNLLGARSFEDAIFRGYLDAVARQHPDAEAPVLHVSDELLRNAVQLRSTMGDDAFFANLGGGDTGWGNLDGAWDAAAFDAAVVAAPGDAQRERLVADLTAAYFSSYARAGEWLPMKDGLHALTAHAKSLGYQGVVFLIDEIVLWLGQHLVNDDWVQGEIEKVVMLAESGATGLPIPITSFLARQRDLRDFLGERGSGAERVAQGQLFSYWEDRFSKIKLQAADLPRIVKQRLLPPVSSEAAETLAKALAAVKRDHAAWGYLLADESNSDERAFADVYPFTPALVDTMVALSSLMQRERTALKLMAELLVRGRHVLTASDVIPVGDLYELVVLSGAQPLTDEMRRHFAISAQFYRAKMRPYLLRKHGVSESAAAELDRSHAFVTEDRLAKTVLIAALAPEAKSLEHLTAAKLAALNWGTISSYIPGAEAQQVLSLVRAWAGEFGEISVGDGDDPIITATLSGVDYDTILDRVRTEDNHQSRRELIRGLIASELGLSADSLVGRQIAHVWRGHKRSVTVKFGNVRDDREVLESDLVHSDAEWRVVIDFPYDSADHWPSDDVARVRKFRDEGRTGKTIAWIPNFLTEARQDDLGKLVLLEYLLTGSRFDQNASHLAVADRGPARQTLESQRRTLKDQLVSVIRQAYGVNTPDELNVGADISGDKIFSTLVPGLTIPQPPTGTLLTGFRAALDTAWAHEYPEHPDLGTDEVSVRRLLDALELVAATVEIGGRKQGLSAVEQRLAKEIVVPLGLGALNENVIVIDAASFRWTQHFARWEAELGAASTVGQLRQKLQPWGMTRPMQDAVLLTWALLNNIVFGATAPRLGEVPDQATPKKANLPDSDTWALAKIRAGGIFGVAPETHLTPRAVASFVGAVRHQATNSKAAELADQLTHHAGVLGIDVGAVTGRLATVRRVAALVKQIVAANSDMGVVDALATFDVPEELTPYGKAHHTAQRLTSDLEGADWQIIEAAIAKSDASFDAVMSALRTAAQTDESIVPLEKPLRDVIEKARALVIAAPESRPPSPRPSAHSRTTLVNALPEALDEVRKEIEREASPDSSVTISWKVD